MIGCISTLLSRYHNAWRPIVAMTFGILVSFVIVARSTHTSSPNTVDWYADDTIVTLRGRIVDEPDRRPLQTKYTVGVEDILQEDGMIQRGIKGNVLVTDRETLKAYTIGDRVSIRGTLTRPTKIDTFHYDHYLSRFGIYSVMYWAEMAPEKDLLQDYSLSTRIRKTLFALKERFEEQINAIFPEPHASFMAGLLTGSRRGIPKDLLEDFNTTGLTHIIAISGFNITIIITLMTSALVWLPPKKRLAPSIIAIIIFVIFVGAEAAVVRAGIMGILGLVALHIGRMRHTRLLILWTAFFMLSVNPHYLWYDAGFQLSFLATVGLMELSPLLARLTSVIPTMLSIRESVQMTIAAQLAATPVILLLFARISIIAPLTNLLVTPLIPIVMFVGASATLLSFLMPTGGLILSYGATLLLDWIMTVATVGALIPFATLSMDTNGWMIASYYATLSAIVIVYQWRTTTYTSTDSSSQTATLPGSYQPAPYLENERRGRSLWYQA